MQFWGKTNVYRALNGIKKLLLILFSMIIDTVDNF